MLVEQKGEIEFVAGSRMAQIYGQTRVVEKYHCSYGIAPRYLNIFNKSALKFTAVTCRQVGIDVLDTRRRPS